MIKCEVCNKWFKTKKGFNIHYERMHKCIQCEEIPSFDMNEIKNFITSEIQRTLKEFRFNGITTQNNSVGIVPIKADKMPIFDPFECNKRLVVKELKEKLKKGITNVLKEVGSFDSDINFLEVPVLA